MKYSTWLVDNKSQTQFLCKLKLLGSYQNNKVDLHQFSFSSERYQIKDKRKLPISSTLIITIIAAAATTTTTTITKFHRSALFYRKTFGREFSAARFLSFWRDETFFSLRFLQICFYYFFLTFSFFQLISYFSYQSHRPHFILYNFLRDRRGRILVCYLFIYLFRF